MNIAVIGRGNVGGGLAKRWRKAGHEVTEFGQDGGDAGNADVVVVAVPSGSIGEALDKVKNIEGKPVVDATNPFRGRREGFESLAHEIKATTGGPVAKAFNANFATLYDKLDEQRERPGCFFAADPEAAGVTAELIRDAGYDPIPVGDLGKARDLEAFLSLMMGVAGSGGPFFYRVWRP
jgi:predicted dinucleotide-binding enzyme